MASTKTTRAILALALIAPIALGLSACGKKGELEHPSTAKPADTTAPATDDDEKPQPAGSASGGSGQ